MIELQKELTIVEAWNELKSIDNRIGLLETLRTTEKDIKSVKMKEILVSGGKVNNNAILNSILACDKYTEELQTLYIAKNAWEKYILEEVNRIGRNNPSIIIGFLKDYQKCTWQEISKTMNYQERQCRRYYAEYKGKTPQDNCQ